jgi:cell wall-associated NlpC family hydrolase
MSWASKYVGIPYKPGGRSIEGIDCWGLICLVSKQEFGNILPTLDETVWNSDKDDQTVSDVAIANARCWEIITEQFGNIPVVFGDEKPGDVMLIRKGRFLTHVAIVVGSRIMLHIEAGHDAVLEEYDNIKWHRRIAKIGRWHGAKNA